jgi:hypothetical protein
MHVLGRGTLVTPPLHFCKCTLSFPTLLYCVIDGVFNGEFWSFLTAIDTDFLPPLPSPLSLSLHRVARVNMSIKRDHSTVLLTLLSTKIN